MGARSLRRKAILAGFGSRRRSPLQHLEPWHGSMPIDRHYGEPRKIMNPRNTRVLVFATALLAAPLLPAWSQPPTHRPQPPKKAPPKGEVIVKEDTPIEQGDPQSQTGQPTQDQGTAQGTATQGTQGTTNPQAMPETTQGQPATPPAGTAPAAPGTAAPTTG